MIASRAYKQVDFTTLQAGPALGAIVHYSKRGLFVCDSDHSVDWYDVGRNWLRMWQLKVMALITSVRVGLVSVAVRRKRLS